MDVDAIIGRKWARRVRDVRGAVRSSWWRLTGEAARLEEENERRRKMADHWRAQYVEARKALWQFKNMPTGSGGVLLFVANMITNENRDGSCDYAEREYDTNAVNCDFERRDEACPCQLAAELRDLEKALAVRARLKADNG